MKVVLIVLSILIVLIIISQLYFTMAKAETQAYQIIKSAKNFEIRFYPPATTATVTMIAKTYKKLASTEFIKLASSIFGGNSTNKNIAITKPVQMNIDDSLSSKVL